MVPSLTWLEAEPFRRLVKILKAKSCGHEPRSYSDAVSLKKYLAVKRRIPFQTIDLILRTLINEFLRKEAVFDNCISQKMLI